MSKCIVFEDGNIIHSINEPALWDGLFSKMLKDGEIMQFIQQNLPQNSIFVVPRSDGNVIKNKNEGEYNDINWSEIEPYIDYAKEKNKIFILGVLCQIIEDKDINCVYLPLDDYFFKNGTNCYFPESLLIPWKDRSQELFWRGGCSGIGGNKSLRVRFVEIIQEYEKNSNVYLSNWWSENKNIPDNLFGDRVHYLEFLKYKYFFIVDGNVIASSHMWGFASGCVPFMISNGIHWFSSFIKPYIHYIPVEYDLSNLIQQIEYVRTNDDIAENISKNAVEFSKTVFSSEFQKEYLRHNLNRF